MSHTPGPWRVLDGFCVYGSDDLLIADLAIKPDYELRANASLIAAAPDMEKEIERLKGIIADLLAALKEREAADAMLGRVPFGRRVMSDEETALKRDAVKAEDEARNIARAAIAKAEAK